MKYLFFDVECSNCFNGVGKICEFGYVLTDNKFNVIAKDDIPMSPGKGRDARFHLRDRMKQDDISLAYDESYYFQCEEFPYFYERIKKLMEDKDTICFAFSKDNDIMHVHNTCLRYKLEPINYICYDVQLAASKYLDIKEQINQGKAFDRIVGRSYRIGLVEHLSRDDAFMEMKILETICFFNKTNIEEEIVNSNEKVVNSLEYAQNVFDKTKLRKEKTKRHNFWQEACDKDGILENYESEKKVSITNYFKNNAENLEDVIKQIHKIGLCSNKFLEADVVICLDENDIAFMNEKFPNEKHKVNYITYENFINKFGKEN